MSKDIHEANPNDNVERQRELHGSVDWICESEDVRNGDFCRVSCKENEELSQPIAPGGRYVEIANRFRSHSDSPLIGDYWLGTCDHDVYHDSLDRRSQFESIAKLACIQMGYAGPRPLRFFLHRLAKWRGEIPLLDLQTNSWSLVNEHKGGDYCGDCEELEGCNSTFLGGYDHGRSFDIDGIFAVAALFCEELEWQARRAEIQIDQRVKALNSIPPLRTSEEPPISGRQRVTKKNDPIAEERTALLNQYVRECNGRGEKMTDTMIAKAARPTWNDRTPVQRWKRNDPRSTPADDNAIRRVLRNKPHLK